MHTKPLSGVEFFVYGIVLFGILTLWTMVDAGRRMISLL